MTDSSAWRAMHFFVGDELALDDLALACRQALRDHASDPEDWFFIRYTEGGLHLRLRCGTGAMGSFDRVVDQVGEECRSLAQRHAGMPAAWLSLPTQEGRLYDPGSAVEIPYAPEVPRYGGPAALALHERLFRVSSAVAATLISRTPHASPQRMQHAIDLMLGTVAALTNQCDPVPFFRDYAESWRRDWGAPPANAAERSGPKLSERYRQHLDWAVTPKGAKTAAELWVGRVKEAARGLRRLHDEGLLVSPLTGASTSSPADLDSALTSMAHSQVHMMNNRLGFWPHYEIMFSERMLPHLIAS